MAGPGEAEKEYDKIKHHLGDTSLSDEQMTVTPLEVQSTGDVAVLHVERVEKVVKTETSQFELCRR